MDQMDQINHNDYPDQIDQKNQQDQQDVAMYDEIWQIIPSKMNSVTNCQMPKHLLNNALKSSDIKLPLLFKITNIQTNKYAICAADGFFDTEEGQHITMLSPIIIENLQITDIAYVELINKSPDLVPLKGKTVFLEPQDELFYKLKDPAKTLENCFKNSYVIGVDYLIPIKLKPRTIYVKIVRILSEGEGSLKYANINNVDLNVEFLPMPEHLKSKTVKKTPKNNVIRKRLTLKNPDNTTNEPPKINEEPVPMNQTQIPPAPIYNPDKQWVPFCGWGRVLSTGAYVPGSSQ